MTINKFVTQTYPIECRGRNEIGDKVLANPVDVKVKISKGTGSNMLSSYVYCPYNTGGRGQRCKASHPDVDKVGEGIVCPYCFDVPYVFDKKK